MDLISIWVPKRTELWQGVDGKICHHDQIMTYFVLEPQEECVQRREGIICRNILLEPGYVFCPPRGHGECTRVQNGKK